jgi:ABC-2 type transport system permease protein
MEMNVAPIVWREFRVQVFNPSKATGNFLVPSFALLFFAVAIGANFPPIRYASAAYDYATFFLPGLIAIQAFLMASYAYGSVRQDRVSRIVAVVATSRTSMVDYMLGKLLGCIVLTAVRSAVLVAVTLLVSGPPALDDPLDLAAILAIVAASTVFWYGLGFTLGALVAAESVGSVLFGIGGTVLTFASTAYYNVERAPAWVRSIAGVNPLSHSSNALRELFLRGTLGAHRADLAIVVALAAVALAAAWASAGRVARPA